MYDQIDTLAGTLVLDIGNEMWQGKLTLLPETEPGIQTVRLDMHSDTPQVPCSGTLERLA